VRAVDVEVVLLGTGDGVLTWEARRRPLGDAAPDEAALALAGADLGPVSHSTSWRDDAGTLVLTYGVVRSTAGGEPPVAPSVVCGPDAHHPAPEVLHGHHVAAHAARHLADLVDRDPVVATALADRSDLVLLLGAVQTAPVAPHAEAHVLARARVAAFDH
jgi:hypothetical protein